MWPMRTSFRLSVMVCLASQLTGCAVAHRVAPDVTPPPASIDSPMVATMVVVGFFIGMMLVFRAVYKD